MIGELHLHIFYDIHALICVIVVSLHPGDVGKKQTQISPRADMIGCEMFIILMICVMCKRVSVYQYYVAYPTEFSW